MTETRGPYDVGTSPETNSTGYGHPQHPPLPLRVDARMRVAVVDFPVGKGLMDGVSGAELTRMVAA